MRLFRNIIIAAVLTAAVFSLAKYVSFENIGQELENKISHSIFESLPAELNAKSSGTEISSFEPPSVPESISNSFGPRTEAVYEITITSGDDLMEQFWNVMNSRAETVTVNVPSGTEEFYVNELKEQISRFTDVKSLSTKWINHSGICTVQIIYNDAAKIMAYLEGKTPYLDETNQAVLDTAVKIHDELITSDMSDYEKVKAYHDYIINTTTYSETGERAHSITGALLDGACVCEGYTEALDLLCYLSGIECIGVSGTGETDSAFGPHAWNKVRLGDKWYNVDVTWDDPVSSRDILRYDYFLISDDKMAQDHEWYLYPHIPKSDSDYDC